MNKRVPKKIKNLFALTSYTLVRPEFAIILLLSENDQIFTKIAKNHHFRPYEFFFDFSKDVKEANDRRRDYIVSRFENKKQQCKQIQPAVQYF